jgi:hypothetical protein
MTQERIRQIEAKALRKLKHPGRSRKLRSFLDSRQPPVADRLAAAIAGFAHSDRRRYGSGSE